MVSEDSLPSRPAPDIAELARVKALLRQRLDLAGQEPSPRIGRFAVLERVGQGGMGIVYGVYDDRLDRRVALKLIAKADTERERARVRREARAMAKLDHPNVVSVFEVGEHEGRLFIVMEYVAGTTLQEWQCDAGRGTDEVLDAYLQAARGLAAAHAAGLVHRDFKPENAIVDETGRVRVLDFGLAYEHGATVASTLRSDSADAPAEETRASSAGALIGTPAYMSAEQFAGDVADHRADQFAFCVALWEALAGERPFAGRTRREIAEAVTAGTIRPPPRPSKLPAWLRPLLERGLDPQRGERWESMDALVVALERGRHPSRGRWRRALTAGGASAAIAAAVWMVRPAELDPCVDASSHFDPVWSPARRESLGEVLGGIAAPFAAAAATKVDGLLAGYADAWIAGYRDACEAHVRGTQSVELFGRRIRCLEERRRHFDALVDVLEEADARVLENAPILAAGLPKTESCADAVYVSADVLPPEDPAVAAEVAELRDELAHVLALEDAGRYAAAKPAAEAAVERAAALEYPPILLDALDRLASVHVALGELSVARDVARRGFVVAGLVADRSAASNHSLLGIVAFGLHDYDEALMHHRRALAIRTALQAGESDEVAATHMNIGNVLNARRELHEARQHFETALAIRTRVWGPEHPLLAANHATIARLLVEEGDYEAAIVEYRRAIEICTATLGEDHPHAIAWRSDVALALVQLGRYEESVAEGEAALAAAMRAPDDNGRALIGIHVVVAQASARLEDDRRDRARFEAALALDLRTHGEEHLEVLRARNELAANAYFDGLHERALDEARKALAIGVRVLGENHADVARCRANIGLALAAQGKPDEAEAELRRALAAATAARSDDVVAHRVDLAGLLHGLGRDAEALELLRPEELREAVAPAPSEVDRLAFTAMTAHALGVPAVTSLARERLQRISTTDPLAKHLQTVLRLVDAVLQPPSEQSRDELHFVRPLLAMQGMWPFVAAVDRWSAALRRAAPVGEKP